MDEVEEEKERERGIDGERMRRKRAEKMRWRRGEKTIREEKKRMK